MCMTWLSLGGYLKVFVDGLKRISRYEAAIDSLVISGIKAERSKLTLFLDQSCSFVDTRICNVLQTNVDLCSPLPQ